ncbi:serine/threonine-protein kinase [Marmoricola sp. Leaf446]|uniref:serine/threonine-protein kinase n=1 Tax=Marmoricola sp. Leaf446 TaxID=1736379 RepID=UPI000B2AE177|nr:serine/threonine-protein kinase [Marmoricola sp. Leaf446]
MTSSARRDEPEEHVGPYRLLAQLGEGGMGVVHLAMAPDGSRVALKVLRPHVIGDREARERLALEVSSLRRIRSPRIAEIIDADPDGPMPYVVTRYVPGLSLYHHVDEEGPVQGRDLLHATACLAEALQAVHDVGVLHRDVKPTNVLMEGRSPVLIDFGLARVSDDPRLTRTGWLLGTPGYLAPEVLYGDDATAASDVHALAATLVFAATGRSPYGGGPWMGVMDRVRRGEHDLTGVPEPLAGLLTACLATEPGDRPTVPEIRDRVGLLQAGLEPRPGRSAGRRPTAPAPEQWTMPFATAGAAGAAVPAPVDDGGTRLGRAGDPAPAAAAYDDPATTEIPAYREAAPYQQPPAARPEAATQVLHADRPIPPGHGPVVSADPTRARPLPAGPPPWLAPTPPEASRAQRLLQLVGLGALAGSVVAYAPYLGTALVGLVVLVLRTASVTRQRHERRRRLRGRERWWDVPASVVASPGYAAVALVGALSGVVVAAVVALAAFSVGYLLQQPLSTCLVLAGVGFVPTLWWGPGSQRLRETTRALVTRTARTEFVGWFVAAMTLLGAAVVLGLLFSAGPNWAPGVGAPWR